MRTNQIGLSVLSALLLLVCTPACSDDPDWITIDDCRDAIHDGSGCCQGEGRRDPESRYYLADDKGECHDGDAKMAGIN